MPPRGRTWRYSQVVRTMKDRRHVGARERMFRGCGSVVVRYCNLLRPLQRHQPCFCHAPGPSEFALQRHCTCFHNVRIPQVRRLAVTIVLLDQVTYWDHSPAPEVYGVCVRKYCIEACMRTETVRNKCMPSQHTNVHCMGPNGGWQRRM